MAVLLQRMRDQESTLGTEAIRTSQMMETKGPV